ncbi:M48 family metallopeptidase [Muricauda sp. AC10]|nr:M48 family metallopeptidase [Muricauda sp. AC10]
MVLEQKIKGRVPLSASHELHENLESFKDFFSKGIERGEYVYDSPFNEKIEEIYEEIHTANPKVPKDFQLLLSRNISLNAYCFANGTMVVNLGTLHYLETEDQLAAIICHEIAHNLLKHSENHILEGIQGRNAKGSRKEYRNLKRERYNRQKKAFEVLKEKLYNNSRKNRGQELEADSLGFVLLKNTRYKSSEMLKALELSLQFDTVKPADLDISVYKKIFDIPEQPFDEKWLDKEDFSKYDYVFEEKLSSDSISSHPEITERIERLKQTFLDLRTFHVDSVAVSGNTDYDELNLRARKELVPNLFYLKKYGFCVYLALYRIQQNFMVDYHKKWLGNAFGEIYKARKKYMANKYIDRIDPENQSESYQQFINFMWNLRLEEIHKIAEFYSKT